MKYRIILFWWMTGTLILFWSIVLGRLERVSYAVSRNLDKRVSRLTCPGIISSFMG